MSDRSLRFITPIKVPKKSEIIARELRNRIVRGELPKGTSLPSEAELIEQFGISRPTLREALRLLEADGLITVKRGSRGGPTVQIPGPELAAHHFGLVLQTQDTELTDVFRARQLIEPPAVRLLIDEGNAAAADILREVIAREWDALDKDDFLSLTLAAAEFHETLVRLTNNKTLLLIVQMLNSVYAKHVSAEYTAASGQFDTRKASRLSIKAHEKLVELIGAGEGDAATSYWREHLAKVRKILFKQHASIRVIDVLD
jgi:DNA-binding FadR family transcriptional regulator